MVKVPVTGRFFGRFDGHIQSEWGNTRETGGGTRHKVEGLYIEGEPVEILVGGRGRVLHEDGVRDEYLLDALCPQVVVQSECLYRPSPSRLL